MFKMGLIRGESAAQEERAAKNALAMYRG